MQEIIIDNENLPVLIFSDLQIHNYKQYNEGDKRLVNCIKVVDHVFKLADKYGIELILFAGDLVDQQRSVPTAVMNAMLKCFKKNFDQYPDILFVSISGNHDYASKNLIDSPAITALESFDTLFNNFYLLDNEVLDIHCNGNRVYLWGIPYYEYSEHFKQKLTEVHDNIKNADRSGEDVHILMQHQTPEGWIDLAADISADDPLYSVFDLVLNGHIHEYRILREENPTFISVGNPLARDLSDKDQDKGILAYDLTNIDHGHRFIDIGKRFPRFITKTEGDELTDDDKRNYVVWQPVETVESLHDQEDAKEFSADVGNSQLLVKYWEKTEGSNRKLLDYGLKLLESVNNI